MNAIPMTPELVRGVLPPRPRDGHKGTFGTAALLCGSQDYPGAALLAAEACLRMGAGKTVLVAPSAVLSLALTRTPELLARPLDTLTPEGVLSAVADASALLVGCGWGTGEDRWQVLERLLTTSGMPLVLDADALNVMASHRERATELLKQTTGSAILTPHPLEFSRISGRTLPVGEEARAAEACEMATLWGAVVLLKGAHSLVALPDGTLYRSPFATSALAKGGSGDVLAGAIVSLLAAGASPADATLAAAYLHAAAGDTLARDLSAFGVTPSDLPRTLSRLYSDLS